MPGNIGPDDEEAKKDLFNTLTDRADQWHAERGKPDMHADVLIEPLLNMVHKAIQAVECPHCQRELRLRCATFFLGSFGIQVAPLEEGDDADQAEVTR